MLTTRFMSRLGKETSDIVAGIERGISKSQGHGLLVLQIELLCEV